MQTQKLSTLEKVGFGAGDMALNVVISSMMLIITFFYTDIYGLKTTDLALLFVIVKIIGALSDLVVGQMTDSFLTRWGRYRPYLLLLAVPYGVSVFMVFSTPDWTYGAKLVWAYSTYILMTVMTSGVGVPYISLISGLTGDPQERLSANGYRLFLAKVGAFMVTIVVPILAQRWGNGNPAAGYQAAMALMAVLGVALFLFCFFTPRARGAQGRAPAAGRAGQGAAAERPVADPVRGLRHRHRRLRDPRLGRDLLRQILPARRYRDRLGLPLDRRGGGDHRDGGVDLGHQVVLQGQAVPLHPADGCRAERADLLPGQAGRHHAGLRAVFRAVAGGGPACPVFWSAIAETIDYGQVKTGKRVSGFAFGGISVAQKAGMAVAGGMVGVLLSYFGYQPNQEQSPLALQGIALMLSVIPGFFHFLMGALMFKYRISDSYYSTVKEDAAWRSKRTQTRRAGTQGERELNLDSRLRGNDVRMQKLTL
jgi:Na+/melibiose symporter-like transporter